MSSITSALDSGFSTVQTEALSLITTAIPYVMAIVTAVIIVKFGIRFFKSVAKG